jgi:hypothetical protein
MLKKNVFIVGVVTSTKKKNGKSTWMAEGLFEKEEAAVKACTNNELFVVEVKPNEMFPKKADDAINFWWPLLEKKEESVIFKKRHKGKSH